MIATMIRTSLRHSHVTAIMAAAITTLHAEVKPDPLLSDGAVLQRDQPIQIRGIARDGEQVTVELSGQKVKTIADHGKWQVELKPLKAGGPFTMTITGDNTVTVKDLLIGDVWLCSGQSNMHFQMKSTWNATTEIAAMNHPSVRFFTMAQQFDRKPLDESSGVWKQVTPSTAADCSAVACYFGVALQRKLGVPVGLVVSSVGGTRIESWMRPQTLASTGESKSLVEKWSDVSAGEFNRIGAAYAEFQRQRDQVHPRSVKEAKAQGKPSPPAPVQPKLRCHDCPGALHNGMIAPLEPFAFRGVIWYQGESNSGQPLSYQKLLPAMIADWRKVWGETLPFLFVQLASYRNTHPAFREAQHHIWDNTPRTAMVVTTDVGDASNIHPTRKRPVGERLALAARAVAYGEQIDHSGPVFKDVKFDGTRAIISFTHVGKGLLAKEGDLTGFTLAGADGKFSPATAAIKRDQVIVTSDAIKKPTAVRYNWAMMASGNLFNRDGLPATPFRSDKL
jgi:sialate O-acetylesterase